jgi:hypothetical protein
MPSLAQAVDAGVDMASAAAAAVAVAKRRVLDYFFTQNAVTPDNAQPFTPPQRLQRKQFERMLREGVIRETKAGYYYVDVPTWHARRYELRKRITLLLLFAVLGTMIALGFVNWHGK